MGRVKLKYCENTIVENLTKLDKDRVHDNIRQVVVFDYLDSRVIIYNGVATASINLKIPNTTIRDIINSKQPKLINGYAFMYLDEAGEKKFPEYSEEEVQSSILEYSGKTSALAYIVKNHTSGEEVKVVGLDNVSNLTGLSVSTLTSLIVKRQLWPLKGYSIKHYVNTSEFPILSNDELIVNLGQINGRNGGYVLIKNTGERMVFSRMNDLSQVLGLRPPTVNYRIESSLGKGCHVIGFDIGQVEVLKWRKHEYTG